MTVYIEYVIIDNFIIDFLLIKSSFKIAKIKSNLLRQIISASVGTAFAIIVPFFNLNGVFNVIVKVLAGFFIVFVGGKYISFKSYFTALFFFFLWTFISGGLIIALFNLADIDYSVYYSINYNSFMPIGISVLLVFLSTKIATKVISELVKYKKITTFIYKCEIEINKTKIKTKGFLDSGNNLYDDLTGLPIIMASKSFVKTLLENKALPNKYRNLEIMTVNGVNEVKIFNIEKLMIYNGAKVNIYNNVLVGISSVNFCYDNSYELLLHSTLL